MLNAAIIAGAGGASQPLGMVVSTTDEGELNGELFFGRTLEAKDVETLRGKGRKLVGQSILAKNAAAQSSAGQ